MASGEYRVDGVDDGDTAHISLPEGPGVIIPTPGGGRVKLAPLDGREPESPSKPLPPIHAEVRGSQPEYTQKGMDTIISVPEGDDKGSNRLYPNLGKGRGVSDSSKGRAVDTIIYTMDKVGLQFTIEDGQTAEAGEMFEYAMEELKLAPEAREIFSLWLVSDLLELQLKPNHVPFKLVCFWDELLEKYTNAAEDDIERDEPILMFQRNVFYPRKKERLIKDPEILRLLYHEAKENIVDARYPLEEDQLDRMAGLQAHIVNQGYRGNTHTPQYYKSKLEEFYPTHVARKKSSFFASKEKLEVRLTGWHRAASKKLEGRMMVDAYRMYLEECWKLPYYGAAFFRGQIEHPGNPIFRSVKDDPVYVAVNTDGVFITDMDDVVFLLGLLYEDMSWEYAEPCDSSNRNCLPCLFLQFKDHQGREEVTKVLQVFSREAPLMDTLIDCCVQRKKAINASPDEVFRSLDDDGDGVLKGDAEAWRQFNRLALTTFKGDKCVGTTCKKPASKKRN